MGGHWFRESMVEWEDLQDEMRFSLHVVPCFDTRIACLFPEESPGVQVLNCTQVLSFGGASI